MTGFTGYDFLEPWIFALLESFPSLSREETKSYILTTLRASYLSDLDTVVDQLIVKYYIEKYCQTHQPVLPTAEALLTQDSDDPETDGLFVHSLMRNKDVAHPASSTDRTQLHMQSIVYSKDSRLTAHNLLMSLSKDGENDPLAQFYKPS